MIASAKSRVPCRASQWHASPTRRRFGAPAAKTARSDAQLWLRNNEVAGFSIAPSERTVEGAVFIFIIPPDIRLLFDSSARGGCMHELSDSLVRLTVLMIAAAVVTSFYCGPAAIVGVVVGLVFLARLYGQLNS